MSRKQSKSQSPIIKRIYSSQPSCQSVNPKSVLLFFEAFQLFQFSLRHLFLLRVSLRVLTIQHAPAFKPYNAGDSTERRSCKETKDSRRAPAGTSNPRRTECSDPDCLASAPPPSRALLPQIKNDLKSAAFLGGKFHGFPEPSLQKKR